MWKNEETEVGERGEEKEREGLRGGGRGNIYDRDIFEDVKFKFFETS